MKFLLRNVCAAAVTIAASLLAAAPMACSNADDQQAPPKGAQTNAVGAPAAGGRDASKDGDELAAESTKTANDKAKPAGDEPEAVDTEANEIVPAGEEAPAAEDPADDSTTDDKRGEDKSVIAPDDGAGRQFVAGVGPGDCNQLGGSPSRNNAPAATNVPVEWEIGEFDEDTGTWKREAAKNIKWIVKLGSQTYGNPVVANGKAYVGTNNAAGYLARYPNSVDLGCLLCFNEADGKFLWQHSSEKLPTGRAHDWEFLGICDAPLVEDDRLWFVTSRGEVACLDTAGFRDGKNDGPFQGEPNENEDEADVIWYVDMMGELKSSQHNMCSCSVTAVGDVLFVCTSNGIDEAHINISSPKAPSFLALDKHTGKILWQDNSPGENILHGQWSSPAYGVFDGVPQVIFAGGDGWLYAFRGDKWKDGKPELLWKFDCNPKESKYAVLGRSTRNHIIGTPVVYEGLVYVAVGEDPEHGQGNGHLWCVNPINKGGDVSSELAFKLPDLEHPIPHTRRLQAVNKDEGEVARANPNSAAVWHYTGFDQNRDRKLSFEEEMHRSLGTAAIKNNLLFIEDLSGLVHCLDAKTGQVHWTHDLMAESWGSPLIVGDKVYVSDSEGKVVIFGLSADPKTAMKQDAKDNTLVPLHVIETGTSPIYTTPIVANNVLYVANQRQLFAIASDDQPAADETAAKDD